MLIKYVDLVFEGGGVKGIALVGVLLQEISKAPRGGSLSACSCAEAATPKRLAMNLAGCRLSPVPTPWTCPFRSLCLTSSPWSVRHAVSNAKKPSPGLTSRLMNRWSGSTTVLSYLTGRSSPETGTAPAALRSPRAVGEAAFLSTVITRGTTG